MINLPAHFTSLQQDAILWKAEYIYSRAKTPDEKASAIETIAKTITAIKSHTRQTTYIQAVEQQLKIKKNLLTKTIESQQKQSDNNRKKQQATLLMQDEEEGVVDEQESKMPAWVSKEDEQHWRRHGYFLCNKMVNDQKRVGFYSISVRQTDAGPVYSTFEITNFITTPIMHVYKGAESEHLITIDNGYVKSTLKIDSGDFPYRDTFMRSTVKEGSFTILGNSLQWLRIATDLLHKFPRCTELPELGYHENGFFAYSDYIHCISHGKLEINLHGIFQKGEKKYLLAQQSDVYTQLIGTGTDPYENDRPLTYKKSPITFEEWCQKVDRVYNIQGTVGIAFSIFTLFRDIITKVTGTSPHLYLFGPPRSGKSVLAKTISGLFYVGRKFFTAYEGTAPAFYTYMSRFVNCPAVINEVDANVPIAIERHQAYKGAFDLEAREKMNMAGKGNKRSTIIQKVNSSLILVGQHLIATDDNALPSRCIIEDFLPNDNRTDEDNRAFSTLDQVSEQGITSLLTDLLSMRTTFQNNFRELYLTQISEWIKETSQKGKPIDQRILNTYAMLATCYKILSQSYTLPVSQEKFTEYCLQKATKWSRHISTSDSLSEFWRYVSFLSEAGQIIDGWDLIIKTETKIETRDGKVLTFDAGITVLYIRLNNIHKIYQAENRKRTGKEGISLESLLHYFHAKKYFIGPIKSMRFKRFNTEVIEKSGAGLYPDQGATAYKELAKQETIGSCHAFMYSEIEKQIDGFNLFRKKEDEINPESNEKKQENWKPSENW